MSSWSKRRKLAYSGSVILILVLGILALFFFFFYKAPTCFDGVKNSNELGIDCGGSCERLCNSAFLSPIVSWTRFQELSPGFYNVATYIINPNNEAQAKDVSYHVALYDDKGILIVDYPGKVTLPPHRNTLAFNSAIKADKRMPAKALFEFTEEPQWLSSTDTLSSIVISEKNFIEDDNNSSLNVTLKNNSLVPLKPFTVYAILYDKDGNTLGFSKTVIDSMSAGEIVMAPFTWPLSYDGKVISIEVLPVAE